MQRLRIQTDRIVSTEIHPTSASKIDCGTDWIGTGPASWSFWMKMVRKNGGSNIRIFDNGSANISIAGVGSTAPLNSSRIVFCSDGRADSSTMPCSDAIPNITNWFHCVITRDASGTANFYINGELSGTPNQATGTPVAAANNVILGNNAASSRGAAAVLFSDLKTFNRVLSAKEVKDLARKNILPFDVATSMTANFPLNDGGTPTIISDISGQGHDGTPTAVIARADVPTVRRKKVGGNRIINGNFENLPCLKNNTPTTASAVWIDGTASGRLDTNMNNGGYGWYLNKSGTVAASFDNTTSHSGGASLKVSTLAVASYAEIRSMIATSIQNLQQLQAQNLRVSPSTTYTLEYWMKTNYVSGDSATGASVNALEYDNTGTLKATNGVTAPEKIKTTTDWTKYSFTFTTSATTNFLLVMPVVYGHTGTATLIMDAWFDDIVLIEPTTPSRQSLAKTRRKVRDFGTGLSFDGATTNRVTTSIVPINSASYVVSFSTWIKWKGPNPSSTNLQQWIAQTTASRFGCIINASGTLGTFTRDATNTSYLTANSTRRIAPGNWYFITYVITQDYHYIYVNGESWVAQSKGPSLANSNTFQIGMPSDVGFERYLNATIDKATLHVNRAITLAEHTDQYLNGNIVSEGLTAVWEFNEGSGATAKDSSGNGNNGTISGAVYTSDVPSKSRTVVN